VPEIVVIGNSILNQAEDCFQVYTIKDDKVVSTIHEFSLVWVTTDIYQTDEGVFVYEVTGDGPETYRNLYKLNLKGLELTKEEVLICKEFDTDSGLAGENKYMVNGKQVSIEEYNAKKNELEALKVSKSLSGKTKIFE
jgi:hypothetical protein